MSMKRYFKSVNSVLPSSARHIDSNSSKSSMSNYSSWLPEVYAGPPDRLQRYAVYDQMNFDHQISAALDTIADFGAEPDPISKLPLVIQYNDEPSPSEIQILEKSISQWTKMNKLSRRIWRIFRSALVYGDQFFIRDPETFQLYWVDPAKVEKVMVNESDGKKIESYFIKDVDLNVKSLVATNQLNRLSNEQFGANSIIFSPPMTGNLNYVSGGYGGAGTANYKDGAATMVDAAHIVQVSLSEGMNAAWPFGLSILEQIYKVYKQKELLEDSIIIYRVHRAPERRVFFIDVGQMPPNKAHQYLERVKYEVQQKRIPSRSGQGNGASMVDATYNPMCLSLDTKIPLLDGRTLELNEIIREYNEGKENWVYSCDPITGEVVPGNISWAGITRKDAQVLKITLDNGETLISTPDHKIPVLGKGFVEAKDLTINDPLISFETKQKSLSHDPSRSYTQIFDHKSNKWVFVHRMVAEFFKKIGQANEFVFENKYKNEIKNTVHHADYNRYNNNPENLQWMNFQDHINYHSSTKKDYWENLSEEESERIKDKIRKGLEKYRDENPDEFMERYENRDTSWIDNMKVHEPEKYKVWRNKVGESCKEFYANNSLRAQELKAKASNSLKKNKAKNQQLVITQEILTRLVEIVKENDSNRLETIKLANNDPVIIKLLIDANPLQLNSTGNVKPEKFTDSKLKRIYKKFGYKNWKDFKEKIKFYNHRIVKIEYLDNVMDVGTITVDGKEKYHNYHTFAIDSGIFIKNSALEDYYFAVSSEGRGSKVEVLPGGDNLGSIDDLKYFNNQMVRALGVPSSYLPTGPDDGTASVSDGRVGSAYIQEFRFSKVVTRYQQLIVEPLDREFKLFLKHRGVTIDNSLFELKFTPAQSFSEYRQLELDAAKINLFTAISDVSFVSKRYALKRYLGWTEAELEENERMWKEERSRLSKSYSSITNGANTNVSSGLSDVGISPSSINDMGGVEDQAGEEGIGNTNATDNSGDTIGGPGLGGNQGQ